MSKIEITILIVSIIIGGLVAPFIVSLFKKNQK